MGTTNETQKQHSGLGIAGMVIGIVSILLSCLVVGGYLGIVGLILSIIGLLGKNKKTGMAIAGVVLNVIAIVIMVIMMLVADSTEQAVKDVTAQLESSTASSVTVDTPEESVPSNSESESLIFNVGDTAEFDGVQYTFLGVEESTGSTFNTPAEGNVFVLAEFEVANNSQSDVAVSSMVSFSAYQDGYAAEYSLNALMDNDGGQLDGTVAPGKKLKGCVGYEVPAGYSELEIQIKPNPFGDDTIVFVYNK